MPTRGTYNRWKKGEKEKMVLHFKRIKESDPGMTVAKFAEAYYPDRTGKTLAQVMYELNRKARDQAKAGGTGPASSNPLKKRTAAESNGVNDDESSDSESDSDSDSSVNDCIEDITFPGSRTPNKRVKSVYTTRSQTWLNKPESPQDTQLQTNEVPPRLDKATPMLSPRLRRITIESSTKQGNINPDLQPSASSMSPSRRHDTIPPPPSKSPSPPPPPPSHPPPAAAAAAVPPLYPLPPSSTAVVATVPHPPEEPEKEKMQTAATENTHDSENKQKQQPTTQPPEETEQIITTIPHIRKLIARQLADFHRTNEQQIAEFKQTNKKQYVEFSQTTEMLFALNQQSEKEKSQLKDELSAFQEQYKAMQTENDVQIAQLQAEIDSWTSEREKLRSENTALATKLEEVQQTLQPLIKGLGLNITN